MTIEDILPIFNEHAPNTRFSKVGESWKIRQPNSLFYVGFGVLNEEVVIANSFSHTTTYINSYEGLVGFVKWFNKTSIFNHHWQSLFCGFALDFSSYPHDLLNQIVETKDLPIELLSDTDESLEYIFMNNTFKLSYLDQLHIHVSFDGRDILRIDTGIFPITPHDYDIEQTIQALFPISAIREDKLNQLADYDN
jgi:hypothetical protein